MICLGTIKILKTDIDEDSNEAYCAKQRLSIVVDEIEQFEWEFLVPMNKSVSTYNLIEEQRKMRSKISHQTNFNKKYPPNCSDTLNLYKWANVFHLMSQ